MRSARGRGCAGQDQSRAACHRQAADGYHLLESLAVFTRFGDRIEIEPADGDAFSVSRPIRVGGAARRQQSGR